MHFEVFLIVALVVSVYLFIKKSLSKLVTRIGQERHIAAARINYVNTVLGIALTILAIVAVGAVIGIGRDDAGLFFGSLFAMFGVALFAQWSILSNLTASIIVFFFFPYRVGDHVQILDGDNTVNGEIVEIALFHVILRREEHLITLPNAMVFQRAVVITAERHRHSASEPLTTSESLPPVKTLDDNPETKP